MEVLKHADLGCIQEVSLRAVADNTREMSKHVESSVNIVRERFGNSYLGFQIAEHSI